MSASAQPIASILIVGLGATACMDLFTLLRRRLWGITALDYALLGRWLGHARRGRFRHARIDAAAPIRGERLLGWSAHYAIGIGWAGVLWAVVGADWIDHPSLLPALLLGVASVAAPFLIMQPALGAGIAAARTPRPAQARWRSLLTHGVFGIGLYLASWLAHYGLS